MSLIDWVDRFAFWEGFHPDLQTLLIYGVGIAAYTALVFAFYSTISRRDPLHSGRGHGWWGRALRHAEVVLTFPVISFGYFALLSLSLFLMSKPDVDGAGTATADILLLAMAAVLGVRVTAHVSERMSNDIAKLLPLSLLAVVLVDYGYLQLSATFTRIGEAVMMAPVLAQYFVLFILAEAGMRGIRALAPAFRRMTRRVEHARTLSKRAMLRDVEHEHGHHPLRLPRGARHEHGPRDRSRDFVTLDERAVGKPGRGVGAGPALAAETRARAPAEAAAARRPAAKSGPGGSGGTFSSW